MRRKETDLVPVELLRECFLVSEIIFMRREREEKEEKSVVVVEKS